MKLGTPGGHTNRQFSPSQGGYQPYGTFPIGEGIAYACDVNTEQAPNVIESTSMLRWAATDWSAGCGRKHMKRTLTVSSIASFVIALVASAAWIPPAAGGHLYETEPNDSCSTADIISTGAPHYGWLDGYPGDYKDFSTAYVAAGDTIELYMSPMEMDVDFQLVLHTPSCIVAAFNYQPSSTPEYVSYTATTSGWWKAEVWSQYGDALYSLTWVVSTPPPPCIPTEADPGTYSEVTLPDGQTYYVEERGNPIGTYPPIPGSGFVLGEGTWVYREANTLPGLQRGDVVWDENCGYGPDDLIL